MLAAIAILPYYQSWPLLSVNWTTKWGRIGMLWYVMYIYVYIDMCVKHIEAANAHARMATIYTLIMTMMVDDDGF